MSVIHVRVTDRWLPSRRVPRSSAQPSHFCLQIAGPSGSGINLKVLASDSSLGLVAGHGVFRLEVMSQYQRCYVSSLTRSSDQAGQSGQDDAPAARTRRPRRRQAGPGRGARVSAPGLTWVAGDIAADASESVVS